MLRSVKLHGVGPVAGLDATFAERLNVLTGDNGLGKSFLLDICFWALTGSWPGGRIALPEPNGGKAKPEIVYHPVGKKGATQQAKSAKFSFERQTWVRPKGRPVMPGLVIYAAVDGGFVVWDPARNYWRDPGSGEAEETELPRAFQFTPATVANGLTEGPRTLCDGLVRDWVTWYYRHDRADRSASPIGLLERVVRQLSHPDEAMAPGKPRRIYLDDAREFPTIDMPYGNVAFPNWSAGVRRIATLAYLLVWAWTEHREAARLRQEDPTDRVVLIVDEIEAHLHPKWQRVILPALLAVAAGLEGELAVQVLTATHSPLILASLEPTFDEDRDGLFWFDLDGKEVRFRPYPWAKQGDVSGWLTSDIFGLRRPRSREAEAVIEAAEAFLAKETDRLPVGLRTREAIEREMHRVLPGDDTLWARWLLATERAGKR